MVAILSQMSLSFNDLTRSEPGTLATVTNASMQGVGTELGTEDTSCSAWTSPSGGAVAMTAITKQVTDWRARAMTGHPSRTALLFRVVVGFERLAHSALVRAVAQEHVIVPALFEVVPPI